MMWGSLFALVAVCMFSPANASWKKVTSEMEGWSSRVSGHKYYAPLRRREDHLTVRKNRHTKLMHRHRQLLNTTGDALISIALKTRKHAKQVLLEDHGSEFTGPVMIGSPGQEQQCIFDTGSSMAWIMSTKCTTDVCKMHHQFDSAKSETWESSDSKMNIQFGTGSLSGTLCKDRVKLGGFDLGKVVLGEITETDGSVFTLPFDGICGLSYKMQHDDRYCFLDSIENSDQLKEKSFTFYFGENDSALIFGEPDSNVRSSEVQWYPVSRKFYWETHLRDVTIDGVSVKDQDKNATVVFDTGTSVLTMPTSSATTTMKLLQTAGLNCKQIERGEAPEVCYHFEGRESICLKHWYEKGESGCTASLMTLDLADENIFILGQPFFSAFVTTFDVGNDRIGVSQPAANVNLGN
uniref:Peptidase A1 domain-containing protein n=1 Tax=Lotharella oceanica TaxID=641309 RepID=A0A7S2U0L1_9EUKA|mmetsp:Transcript_4651/g.9309  ORF Transcript_4651/g.9309 Transcript_4651/m.9309 type:complete len:408 (+) Transcript_4651:90-1313(+)